MVHHSADKGNIPGSEVTLSIIIVNWNTRDLLAGCLASIYSHPPTATFEVIVVDNASADGSETMTREGFPQVLLIENTENIGFVRANNQAIAVSRGRYILLLNSDTIILPNTFDPLLAAMKLNPKTGAAGPMLLNPDRTFQASHAAFPTLTREFLELFGMAKRIWGPHYPSCGPKASQQTREVDWVGGACLLVRRACIEQVGLLDESIVMYGEEVDWCYRIKHANWKVLYTPEASIIHFGGQSSVNLPVRRYLQLQRGRVIFFRKHRNMLAVYMLILFIRLSNLIKIIVYGLQTRPIGHLDERSKSYLAAVKAQF